MSRTSPPCSSSARRGPAPVRLEWRARRRARPSLRRWRLRTLSARRAPGCRGTGARDVARTRSGPFLDESREISRDRWLRFTLHGHARAFLPYHNLLACLALIGIGIIAPRMGATALGSLQCGACRGFGHDYQRPQVDRRMPPRVVLATARNSGLERADLQLVEFGERGLETQPIADDAGVALHDRLQCRLYGKGILAPLLGALERSQCFLHRAVHLGVKIGRASCRERV